MRFSKPLLRLPIQFSVDRLASEVAALPPSAWTAHPQKFPGNSAVRLITADGQPTDVIEGAMGPTPYLLALPYVMHIMATIGAVWGRSRLMALAPGSEVPAHIDSHYYWRTHIRIHVPVITNPDVRFICGDETVHMAPGECWVFDSFQRHEVQNGGSETRVHLVLDTVGGGQIHNLIDAAQSGSTDVQYVEPAESSVSELAFERVNVPDIMSPWEIRCHVEFIAGNATPHPSLAKVMTRIERFIQDWAALWAQFGEDVGAAGRYGRLIAGVRRDMLALGADRIQLQNGVTLQHIFDRLIVEAAIQSARRRPPPALRQAS